MPSPNHRPPIRPTVHRRLALITLVLALVVPAGIVVAGGGQTFTDVPPSNPFFADIEALVDAEVTRGCTLTLYCPKNNVTREQMAAFMNRLGALGAGTTPRVNADRLDGRHASDLVRVASISSTSLVTINNNLTVFPYPQNLVITAPTAGFVTVNAGITFRSADCADVCFAYGHVRHVESGAESTDAGVWVSSTIEQASGSVHRVFAVEAGINTFRVELHRSSNSGTIRGYRMTATAMFTPFGSTGGSTLDLTDAAHGDIHDLDTQAP